MKNLPDANDVVMVKIKAITDIGINVILLEYNNIETYAHERTFAQRVRLLTSLSV